MLVLLYGLHRGLDCQRNLAAFVPMFFPSIPWPGATNTYLRKDQLALHCISADCLCELHDGQRACNRKAATEVYSEGKSFSRSIPEVSADNSAAK